MEFKVRLFLGDRLLDPSDYDKVAIHCKDIDRIVNDIYERNLRWRTQNGLPPPEEEVESEAYAKRPSVLRDLQEKQAMVRTRQRKAPDRKESREAAR